MGSMMRLRAQWTAAIVSAGVAAHVHAAGEPLVATEARDVLTVQALNPLPHCLSSWPAMLDWLRQGFARAPDRPTAPSSMADDARWIRLDKAGRVMGTDQSAEIACIQDRMTQLVWATGLEGKALIRRFPGGPVDISTEILVQRAGSERWCGKSDWRLPSKTQVLSLANFARERVDGENSAWRQLGFPAGSVWTRSDAVTGSQQGEWWTVSPVAGYTYRESTVFNASNDAQRHATLLVTSGSCTLLNRAFAK